MVAYYITYTVKSPKHEGVQYCANVDARDLKSAKRKLGKKHGYKDGRMIRIARSSVIGYF